MKDVRIIKDNNTRVNGKVYLFSNENLNSFNNIYNFDGSKILSVIGSGDQYFSSMLFGAKSVDLFDVNEKAIYYFLLKYVSIKHLPFEVFVDFYNSNLDDLNVYKSIREFLPFYARVYFDTLYRRGKLFSLEIIYPLVNKNEENIKRIIPYFNADNYYKLQKILNERDSYPHFYISDFMNLFSKLDKEYDVMFFSNIFAWLDIKEKKYVNFLIKYYFTYLSENGSIQMFYNWFNDKKSFKGFSLVKRVSVESAFSPLNMDSVFTLKK